MLLLLILSIQYSFLILQISVASPIFTPFNIDPFSFFTVSVTSPHSSLSVLLLLILPIQNISFLNSSLSELLLLILPIQFDPPSFFSLSIAHSSPFKTPPSHHSPSVLPFLILPFNHSSTAIFAYSSFFPFLFLPYYSTLFYVYSSLLILCLLWCSFNFFPPQCTVAFSSYLPFTLQYCLPHSSVSVLIHCLILHIHSIPYIALPHFSSLVFLLAHSSPFRISPPSYFTFSI